jgi:periplasmic protein TonB
MTEPAAAEGQVLLREPGFRLVLIVSVVLHAAGVGLLAFAPSLSFRMREERVFVQVLDAMPAPPSPAPPAPAPAPEPPAPEPPPPEPPAPPPPAPEPPAPEPPAPEPPKQMIDEAVVIPAVPRTKPRDRPKPPKPEPTPEPPKQAEKPRTPPPSASDLIAAMRSKVSESQSPPAPGQAGPQGTLDPEMASYQQRLLACFYSKWTGVQAYARRKDLIVEFEVRVTSEGAVRSVDKVRASGEVFLDQSAERAIQRCAPFPPPPRGRDLLRFIFVPGDAS